MDQTVGGDTSYPTESTSNNTGSAAPLQPYQLGSGVMRGTQIIQNGDGSYVLIGNIPGTTDFGIGFYDTNGKLISKLVGSTRSVYNSSGQIQIVDGLLSTGEYGTAYYDTNGKIVQKIVAGTRYIYDPSNGYNNIMQDGILPDGSGGWVVATPGNTVQEIY